MATHVTLTNIFNGQVFVDDRALLPYQSILVALTKLESTPELLSQIETLIAEGKLASDMQVGGTLSSDPDVLPMLSWAGNSIINIIAEPGKSNVLTLVLQNGKQYSLTCPKTFDITKTGAGGLDAGSEEFSTWYYLYAAVVGESLAVVGSKREPTIGPVGMTQFKYLGAVFNDDKGNIAKFDQVGSDFVLRNKFTVERLSGDAIVNSGQPIAISLLSSLPKTAASGSFIASILGGEGKSGTIKFYNDPNSVAIETLVTNTSDITMISKAFKTRVIGNVIYRKIDEIIGNLTEYVLQTNGWVDSYLA